MTSIIIDNAGLRQPNAGLRQPNGGRGSASGGNRWRPPGRPKRGIIVSERRQQQVLEFRHGGPDQTESGAVNEPAPPQPIPRTKGRRRLRALRPRRHNPVGAAGPPCGSRPWGQSRRRDAGFRLFPTVGRSSSNDATLHRLSVVGVTFLSGCRVPQTSVNLNWKRSVHLDARSVVGAHQTPPDHQIASNSAIVTDASGKGVNGEAIR